MSDDQLHRAFEWDEAKRLKNIEKHEIDFVEAVIVLLGRNVDVPTAHDGEPRRKATGFHGGRFITVIYTPRNGKTRIISARRARHDEQRAYRQLHG